MPQQRKRLRLIGEEHVVLGQVGVAFGAGNRGSVQVSQILVQERLGGHPEPVHALVQPEVQHVLEIVRNYE